MATSTLSHAPPSQLCSSKNGIFTTTSQTLMNKPTRTNLMGKGKGMKVACQASSIPADRVPDMGKRELMNLLLLGAISLPSAGMLVPYAAFFAPPGIKLWKRTCITVGVCLSWTMSITTRDMQAHRATSSSNWPVVRRKERWWQN